MEWFDQCPVGVLLRQVALQVQQAHTQRSHVRTFALVLRVNAFI
jgi:hypothetical protein